jgi:O-antigen/teichoic acid export membrane protein
LKNIISKYINGKIISNSSWGISSSIIQNILYSGFFIIIARQYEVTEFSSYIISNNIYGLMLSFSAMGLGQWFIRSLMKNDQIENNLTIAKFFKMQLILGIIFYLVNVTLSALLYRNVTIIILSAILGVNIIFDNLIYVIKHINIKNFEQKKTFAINISDAILKFSLAIVILFIKIPLIPMVFSVMFIRFISLNMFIKYGTSDNINIKKIINQEISYFEIKNIIINNYSFVIIGSISVLFWSLGGIIVSVFYTLNDVSNYEIAFKLFSMAEIIPVIVSSSIFPMLIKLDKENYSKKIQLYKNAFMMYSIYGLLSYTFMLSYSKDIIPFAFGINFGESVKMSEDMFLTMVLFPSGLLQANMLISMNHEKLDMKLNTISLTVNLILSMLGTILIGKIFVVNYSIFIAFLVFHLLQNIYLVRFNVLSINEVMKNYAVLISIVISFEYINKVVDSKLLFFYYWIGIIIAAISIIIIKQKTKLFSNNKLDNKRTEMIKY